MEVSVESQGCKVCDNTGLDGASADAKACSNCDGSPFGAPREEVAVSEQPKDEKPKRVRVRAKK